MKHKLLIIIVFFMIVTFGSCSAISHDIIYKSSPTSEITKEIEASTPLPKQEAEKPEIFKEPITKPTEAAVNNITSHYADVNFNTIYNLEGEKLDEIELAELEKYLQERDFNGLLYSEFSCPEEISLQETFYNYLDFSSPLSDEECERFYPGEEVWWDAWYNTSADMDAFLKKYTGLSLSYYEAVQPSYTRNYEESIDGYLYGATDYCGVILSLNYGTRNGDEITVWYENTESDFTGIRLTLKLADGYYQFVSNISDARLKADYLIEMTDMDDPEFTSYTSSIKTDSGETEVTFYYWKDTKELIYATQAIKSGTLSYYYLDGECFYINNSAMLYYDWDEDYNGLDIFSFTRFGEDIISAFKSNLNTQD